MKILTDSQKQLLQLVKNNPGKNTHELAQIRGDRQSYERYLKDRLYRLHEAGYLTVTVTVGPRGYVTARRWE